MGSPRSVSTRAWGTLRMVGLGLPIALVVAGAAVALRSAWSGGLGGRGWTILGDTVAVVGLGLLLSAPLALRIALWACRRGAGPGSSRVLAIAAAVPPVVLGVAVGSAFRLAPTELPFVGWACAITATAAAMTPRLALELAGVTRAARTTLIEAALALGAENRAAVRLALQGDEAVPPALRRAAAAAIGDGVAAIAALAICGPGMDRPLTVGMALVGEVPEGTRGACALAILALSAALTCRLRWRRSPSVMPGTSTTTATSVPSTIDQVRT